MDNNELRFKLDEHIDNLFAKAKETKNADDLKAITEAIDIAKKIRPEISNKNGNAFNWLIPFMILNGGFSYCDN